MLDSLEAGVALLMITHNICFCGEDKYFPVTPSYLELWATFSREVILPQWGFSYLPKRSTLKGKNLLPLGANSFLLEKTLSEGNCCA